MRGISIHALLAESDSQNGVLIMIEFKFLSTLSLRRATGRAGRPPARLPDFYPRSPCGERRQQPAGEKQRTYFYPRSPCGERQYINSRADHIKRFLSTLSLRRATASNRTERPKQHISIHALLAESDPKRYPVILGRVISIHALLAESDGIGLVFLWWGVRKAFLSTLSLRRATSSIDDLEPSTTHFYPRSPCGERPIMDNIIFVPGKFLSTLSLRRATKIPD